MKLYAASIAFVYAFAFSSCGANGKESAEGPPIIPGSVEGIQLLAALPTDQWVTPLGDLAGTRFSPLDQINTGNIKGLHPVSTRTTGIPHGHEGGPLVVNGTMYVVTPFPNHLIAVDLNQPNGPVKWDFDPHANPRAVGVACCDVVNRGASFADGKIVYNTLDGNTIAVNEKGEEVWRSKVADPDYGETLTMAPLIVRNHVFVGNSGGELGVRGRLTALDLASGKEAWRAYSSGSDEDVKIGADFQAFYAKDRGKDLGMTTWSGDGWKQGGGTIWGWVTYDPELDLIFYSTGNAEPWNPDQHPGDNKWSVTLWARDPETGQARWANQLVPHDSWDYDEIMENIAVDMPWNGEMRKLLLHPGRTGFVFVLDRNTGEILSAEKFMESTNWASGYDLKTGLPNVDESKRPVQDRNTEGICPSSTGAKEFVPSSFSPRTGLLYIPAHNTCMNYQGLHANLIPGTPYLGASVKMFPGPGGFQGELIAWDVSKAQKVWSVKDERFPMYSGVLSTAGDVVFYGTMEGWFRAANAKTGDLLWEFKTPSGIVGNPMTFMGPGGKQYVAVYSGIGGWMGAVALPSVSLDDPYAALGVVGAMKEIKKYSAPGGTVFVFGL